MNCSSIQDELMLIEMEFYQRFEKISSICDTYLRFYKKYSDTRITFSSRFTYLLNIIHANEVQPTYSKRAYYQLHIQLLKIENLQIYIS